MRPERAAGIAKGAIGMEETRKTLGQLFVPICLETLFFMLAGMVDTLMLSSVSDQAVGAVGTSNTYISIFLIMFSVISMGMMAVMTQNIGAKRPGVAWQARRLGIVFNSVVGVILSVVLFFFSGKILAVMGIAASLRGDAESYLRIVGGTCLLPALIPIFSGYLRAFSYTKQSLFATVIANLLNIGLNALFLFGLDMGVAGVAIATVISRLVNLIIVMVEAQLLVHAKEDDSRMDDREIFGQIIRIGLPSALETALYEAAMILVVRFMNQMDADGMNVTARSYAVQIANFSYSVGAALAQANAIMCGWRIGAQEYEACDKGTRRAAVLGIAVAAALESIFALCGSLIMRWFSDDPQMVSLVCTLLAIDIVLEMGRVSNLVFGSALKTAGDAIFPVVIGAVFMYLCAVGGTYVFGIRMGLLAVGAQIGMALDECIRAVAMFLRWRSGKWKKMRLVRGDIQ